MPAKLPATNSRQVLKVLESLGFQLIRQLGVMPPIPIQTGDGQIISIHPGKIIPKGTLHKIIRDAGLTVDEFLERL